MIIKKNIGLLTLTGIGILLTIMLLAGQTIALINHEFTVLIGLQESAEEVTDVGIVWAKGFALGDTIFYIPLLLMGIIGLFKKRAWGLFSMLGAMAITIYWPAVNLYAVYAGRDVMNLSNEKYLTYSILLPLITIYGMWGIWYLYKNRNKLINNR